MENSPHPPENEIQPADLLEQYGNNEYEVMGIRAPLHDLRKLCPVSPDDPRMNIEAENAFIVKVINESGGEVLSQHEAYFRQTLQVHGIDAKIKIAPETSVNLDEVVGADKDTVKTVSTESVPSAAPGPSGDIDAPSGVPTEELKVYDTPPPAAVPVKGAQHIKRVEQYLHDVMFDTPTIAASKDVPIMEFAPRDEVSVINVEVVDTDLATSTAVAEDPEATSVQEIDTPEGVTQEVDEIDEEPAGMDKTHQDGPIEPEVTVSDDFELPQDSTERATEEDEGFDEVLKNVEPDPQTFEEGEADEQLEVLNASLETPELSVIASMDEEDRINEGQPAFIETFQEHLESHEFDTPEVEREVRAIFVHITELAEQVVQLDMRQVDEGEVDSQREEVIQQMEVAVARMLQCLGQDADKKSVRVFVQQLVESKQSKPARLSLVHIEDPMHERKFAPYNLSQVVDVIQHPTHLLVGRCAVAAA